MTSIRKRILLLLSTGTACLLISLASCERSAPADSAGRAIMVFEIDDSGLDEESKHGLAQRMTAILQKRVDPKGEYDLKWRAIPPNRIEVELPLPSREMWKLRVEYDQAAEDLFSTSVTRSELEAALKLTDAERDQTLAELIHGIPEREQLALRADEVFDTWVVVDKAYRAIQPDTQPTSRASDLARELAVAEDALDDAINEFLATSLDPELFMQVLEMYEQSPVRKPILEEYKNLHPNLADRIDNLIVKHKAWCDEAMFLDGPNALKKLLAGAGVLEFRILTTNDPEHAVTYDRYRIQLEKYGPHPAPEDELGWFKLDNPLSFLDLASLKDLENFNPEHSRFVVHHLDYNYYVLAKLGSEHGLLVDGTWRLKNAYVDRDERERPRVLFELDAVGGGRFEELTRQNINKPLCILVDDVAYSAPTIKSKIRSKGAITGDFGMSKASYLAQTMQAGALPVRLRPEPVSVRIELKPAQQGN
ncbi:MAG: hypothetical protein ABIG44_14880 [Planctomycetota bacterium]